MTIFVLILLYWSHKKEPFLPQYGLLNIKVKKLKFEIAKFVVTSIEVLRI